MKKQLIPILLAGIALTACEKEPDTDKLDNHYLVYTDYDKGTNFEALMTYYVPDSILYINNGDKKEYWRSDAAEAVRMEFIENMNEHYVRVDNIEDADIGLQLSYVASTYTFAGYGGGDPWWYGYPYYWTPGYWGGYWGGWYYSYPIIYSYTTGSIIGEMVNLSVTDSKKLPVIWSAYISGILNSQGKLNLQKTEAAINQAFKQTSVLK